MTDLYKITRQKCPMPVEEYEREPSLNDYRDLGGGELFPEIDELQSEQVSPMGETDTPENLEQWLVDVPQEEIDATLEWLKMANMLNGKGERFEREFWYYTWHED